MPFQLPDISRPITLRRTYIGRYKRHQKKKKKKKARNAACEPPHSTNVAGTLFICDMNCQHPLHSLIHEAYVNVNSALRWQLHLLSSFTVYFSAPMLILLKINNKGSDKLQQGYSERLFVREYIYIYICFCCNCTIVYFKLDLWKF